MDLSNYIYQERIKTESLPKTVIRLLKFVFNWWRTIPCQIAYFCSINKNLVLSDFGTYRNTVRTLIFAKHNRNLFYHRMGRSSVLYSWLLPGESSLKLPFSCRLGKHAVFVHNDSCHLNAESIGDNFICYPHVVIGSKNLLSHGRPSIGNNVVIGTGAVIVGAVTIGDNVKIGANTYLYQDVPSGSVIINKSIEQK